MKMVKLNTKGMKNNSAWQLGLGTVCRVIFGTAVALLGLLIVFLFVKSDFEKEDVKLISALLCIFIAGVKKTVKWDWSDMRTGAWGYVAVFLLGSALNLFGFW